ncbi:MAG: putative N-acetylmannosamine-6-phosphate 2-epimerase, partial [Bryobacter sp.]|nr:putative N-acetylmannosamine-6-phosphate 2-epimerase [Bryobacter sp.]
MNASDGAPPMRESRWRRAQGRLIVSCQASSGDAFHGSGNMALFARAAVDGGAGAIRAHGPEDVSSIVAAVDVPVLAIHKELIEDGAILITPSFERAQSLAKAGAGAIALDCTARGVRHGALDRLRRIRKELGLPVMADIATLEEADASAAAGAGFVLSTMRGYTDETRGLAPRFEPDFIAELVRRLPVPVIAEGRIQSPSDARAAMEAGAWAVVVGSAITRPHEITRGFAQAVESASKPAWTVAIDVGATNIKAGLVSGSGMVEQPFTVASARGGAALVEQIRAIAKELATSAKAPVQCLAVATAGWVDPSTGAILHATGNIKDWTGAPIAETLRHATGLPVFVENDAICAAAGEWLYGAARGTNNALCLTMGTGIGAGAIVEGRLLKGAHGLAQMLGHIPLPGSERECNCGLRGCVEAEAKLLANSLGGEAALDQF